jgi:2-hydroxycyclohexanecarboxyl-CoA dehydrogenase
MRGLAGKRAIVTGAASGIGRAIAQRLGEEGAVVGVFDINQAGASETANVIAGAKGIAHALTCDITDYGSVVTAVQRFTEVAGGAVDVLVNNAGWDTPTKFVENTPEFWTKVINLNLYGPLHVTHAVAKGMHDRGSGRIIFIASDAGRVGSSGEVVYSACKGGTIAFAKALARELARKSVLVNVVCPGPTNTPAFGAFMGSGDSGRKLMESLSRSVPLGRIGEPADVQGIVAFLASDDASFITGQTISVSGGLTMHG